MSKTVEAKIHKLVEEEKLIFNSINALTHLHIYTFTH